MGWSSGWTFFVWGFRGVTSNAMSLISRSFSASFLGEGGTTGTISSLVDELVLTLKNLLGTDTSVAAVSAEFAEKMVDWSDFEVSFVRILVRSGMDEKEVGFLRNLDRKVLLSTMVGKM
ncbi:hypothetical protein OGATHE_006588 [Ogataea polymorpha]|uniref:Uncharacterized protein n=1 Tax=Ogataea polymorpha TaxID=460523 RepID=A0A9P8NSD8_9ASCO|nr:hypothetical protein OGATHE_006588 [Ogataea polymorpha]